MNNRGLENTFRFLKSIPRIIILWSVMLFYTFNLFAQGNEYSIKAMFIINFIKYVEWPEKPNVSDFRIGVVGESEITNQLTELIKRRTAGQSITIVTIDIDNLPAVDILFIPTTESKKLRILINHYQNKGVLVITEENKNASSGAAINLLTKEDKIKFEIYPSQAKAGGVRISSRLSELAIKVYQ